MSSKVTFVIVDTSVTVSGTVTSPTIGAFTGKCTQSIGTETTIEIFDTVVATFEAFVDIETLAGFIFLEEETILTSALVTLVSVDARTFSRIWVTVVKSNIRAFIDVSAITSVTIDIVETILTSAIEGSIVVSACGIVVTVMWEVNGCTFVDIVANNAIAFVTISTCTVESTSDVDTFSVDSATVIQGLISAFVNIGAVSTRVEAIVGGSVVESSGTGAVEARFVISTVSELVAVM